MQAFKGLAKFFNKLHIKPGAVIPDVQYRLPPFLPIGTNLYPGISHVSGILYRIRYKVAEQMPKQLGIGLNAAQVIER